MRFPANYEFARTVPNGIAMRFPVNYDYWLCIGILQLFREVYTHLKFFGIRNWYIIFFYLLKKRRFQGSKLYKLHVEVRENHCMHLGMTKFNNRHTASGI
jgi:hypothetical protein